MPIRLDLLRHGEAVTANRDDSERALSERGRKAIARLAEEFLVREWRPARVFSSPLRRARETAAILIERAAPGVTCEVLEELSPEREPEELVEAMLAQEVRDHVVLVGHQPLLGRLATYLTGGSEFELPAGALLSLACADPLGSGCAELELELRSAEEP